MTDKAPPDEGSPVLDRTTGRLAEFTGRTADCWRLRPVLGGAEWEVRPEDVWLTEGIRISLSGSAPYVAPEPVAECDECADWWWAERYATDADELSEAADGQVFLWRHLAVRHGRAGDVCVEGSL
ncbi:hypothetical protein [Streptomyces sp. NPDC055094]